MSKLKPGWKRVKFGDVVRLNKDTSKDPLADGLDRYVGLEHLEPGDLQIRSWGDVADGTTFTNRFRPGHLLFGKRRAYQRKVAVADFEGVCSGDIYVLESKDQAVLLPELLPFICQTDAFFEHAVGTSAGSLSPRTNWKSLAGYEFALPQLEEQRRILNVLAPIEHARVAASKAATAGKEAFATLTWQATTGALGNGARSPIHSWRYARLPGVTELPNSWQLTTLTDVARLESGHTPSKRRGDYWNGGVPWISLADIKRLDVPEIAGTEHEVSLIGIDNSSARLLPRGTVVLSRTAMIGFTSVMGREMATSQDFANFVCDETQLQPRFLFYLFLSMREYFDYIAIGSSNVNTIYMPFFQRMQVLLPPVHEQKAIVELLDEVWAGLQRLRARVGSHGTLLRVAQEELLGKGAS